MYDVSGQQLELGDKVAITVVTSTKAVKMVVGNILKFTDKGARIIVNRKINELRGTYFSEETHKFGHIRAFGQICFIARDPYFVQTYNPATDNVEQ